MAAPLVLDGHVEDDLGPALVALNWIFFSVATAVVTSRFYVRHRIVRKLGIDDALILVTLMFAACMSVLCTISTQYGLGRHVQFLEPDQIMYSVKYVYLCEFFAIMCPAIGRISYAFLLLELVPPMRRKRIFLWTVVGAQLVVTVGTAIIVLLQCRPIQKFWKPKMPGNCWPAKVQIYTGFFEGSFSSAVDLTLALFPISLFWNLQMKLEAKIRLCILMGLGLIAMVASIFTTVELQVIFAQGDLTYGMAKLGFGFTLEAYLVCIAASIPTLRPILRSSSKRSKIYRDLPAMLNNEKPLQAPIVNGLAFDASDTTVVTKDRPCDYDSISYVESTGSTATDNQREPENRDESVIWREITVDVSEVPQSQDCMGNGESGRVHGLW